MTIQEILEDHLRVMGQRESELERIEVNNPGTLSNEKQG